MQRLRTLLDVDIEGGEGIDHEEVTANRKVVLGASRSVLETLVKVDENRLRKQTIDTLPQLLDEIRDFRKQQGAITVVQ